MKKILQLFIILCIPIFICSCGNKKEYHLIEITATDLVNHLSSEEHKDLVFAFVDETADKYNEYMDYLGKVVNNAKINIYYVDYNHIDISSDMALVEFMNITPEPLSYFIYKNGEIKVATPYEDYQSLYNNLKGLGIVEDIDITPKEELTTYYNKALEEYENGNIGLSNDYLNLSWTLDESKNFYKEHSIFNITHSWEDYEFKDDTLTDMTYTNLIFFPCYDYFISISEKGKYEGYEKPEDLSKYVIQYYYIKDDIIYVNDTKEGTYKKLYQIKKVSPLYLVVTNLKNNKEYEFIRRD